MNHFHLLTVEDVRRETPDCVSVAFRVPEEIQEQFNYVPGQSLTIKTKINNTEIRRSYSICSSPHDNELRIAIKKVEQGIFSCYANGNLKKGDTLEVLPPTGNFINESNVAHNNNYVAFAAGSGITPIISIIKTTLFTEPQSSFTLVYGNRSRSNIIFREQLESIKNKFVSRFNIIHVLSREQMDAPLNFGRINKEKCSIIFNKLIDLNKIDRFFLCGPSEMIFEVKDYLSEYGVDRSKIRYELFGTPVQKAIVKKTENNSEVKSRISIKLDGNLFEFDLAFNGDSILDAALAQGADLPYACKGGVCCTCRAKLVEGEVKMDLNYALEPEEVEQGFVLTCQSHPVTEKVVIDYDMK